MTDTVESEKETSKIKIHHKSHPGKDKNLSSLIFMNSSLWLITIAIAMLMVSNLHKFHLIIIKVLYLLSMEIYLDIV